MERAAFSSKDPIASSKHQLGAMIFIKIQVSAETSRTAMGGRHSAATSHRRHDRADHCSFNHRSGGRRSSTASNGLRSVEGNRLRDHPGFIKNATHHERASRLGLGLYRFRGLLGRDRRVRQLWRLGCRRGLINARSSARGVHFGNGVGMIDFATARIAEGGLGIDRGWRR